MPPLSAPHGSLHEAVLRHLRERAVRYTAGRKAVVEALHRASGPQSAADLHRRLKTVVPLSSLYRSLAVLDQADVLRKQHDAGGLARFELAEWLSGHHHHLVCIRCGAVTDVPVDPAEERALARMAGTIAARGNHAVAGHSLEVEGLCARCRS
jgi:Fe2+ or Zn2+ uptake regulation protein